MHVEFLEQKSLRTPAHPGSQPWDEPQPDNPGRVFEISKPVRTVFRVARKNFLPPKHLFRPQVPAGLKGVPEGTLAFDRLPNLISLWWIVPVCCQIYLVGLPHCPLLAWVPSPLFSPLSIPDKPTTVWNKPELALCCFQGSQAIQSDQYILFALCKCIGSQ